MPTTYTSLLRRHEFRALFASSAAMVAAGSAAGLGLAALVDRATGSPFLTALSLFGATFGHVAGGMFLMSFADTGRPRRVLVLSQSMAVLAYALQALPLPLMARFALLLAGGVLGSLSSGIRLGLLSEVVPPGAYAPARSLLNLATGATQIAGFGLASLVLTARGPTAVFLTASATALLAAVVVGVGVRQHSVRLTARPGLGQTLVVNRWMAEQRHHRVLITALWVPNGLVVGCEALFVPYAGGESAGILMMAAAGGMMLGDLIVGRAMSAQARVRTSTGLRLLLAVPYLAFLLMPELGLAAVLAALASLGFAGSLVLQEQLLRHTPADRQGQVQGVEASGRMTFQGICAAAAGGLAEVLEVPVVMALLAGTSMVITLALRPGVRRAVRAISAARTDNPRQSTPS